MLIDLEKTTAYPLDELILKTTMPRPIAWIVTKSQKGLINIAPFSLFTPLSFNPVTILISFRAKVNGEMKDTFENIRLSKRCTLCMVQEADLEKMNLTANDIEKEMSEAEVFDIAIHSVKEDYPPVITSSPIAYFCEFEQTLTLKDETVIPLVLKVNSISIDDKHIKEEDGLEIRFNPLSHVFSKEYRGEGKELSPK